MSESGDLEKELAGLNEYSRLPARLGEMFPALRLKVHDDVFGVVDRLQAIQAIFSNRRLGSLTDLGGNSGYFSLSLVDAGIATNSVVYDFNPKALAAGRIMARALKLDNLVKFEEQALSLAFARDLPPSDTFVCLNLLHHAGIRFDVDPVLDSGWDAYAKEWLNLFRQKSRVAILGLGLKSRKPPHWNVPPEQRASRFCAIAREAGWSILYDANVEDIRLHGWRKANHLTTKNNALRFLVNKLRQSVTRENGVSATQPKVRNYHLFILE
jgi:hypothetical protein